MTALSFSEQFREGNTSYVSPTKLGNLLGFQSVSYTHLTLPTNREV